VRDAESFPRWLRRIVERRCDALQRAGAERGPRAGAPDELVARVEGLPKQEERSVALLVHLAGCTPADAALFLGIAPSDVHSRLAIAHGRLKKGVVRKLGEALEPLRPSRASAFVEAVLASLPEARGSAGTGGETKA
jgi:DNA-directed RNA polymerase specialized sigma24 family protein